MKLNFILQILLIALVSLNTIISIKMNLKSTAPTVAEKPVYIIAYGSLISKDSRESSDPTIKGKPYYNINTLNYERGWNYKCDHSMNFPYYTALGVTKKTGQSFNAVMFMVADKGEKIDLEALDKREALYNREQVKGTDIKCEKAEAVQKYKGKDRICKDEAVNSIVYIYAVKDAMKNHKPSKEFPLVQTYIDLALNAIVKENKATAVQFVKTTGGWNSNYWNDREKNTVGALENVVSDCSKANDKTKCVSYKDIDDVMTQAFKEKPVKGFDWNKVKNNKRTFWRKLKNPKQPYF